MVIVSVRAEVTDHVEAAAEAIDLVEVAVAIVPDEVYAEVYASVHVVASVKKADPGGSAFFLLQPMS